MQQIRLQGSPIDVNTPIRAWRKVFKNTTLLDKTVWYNKIHRLAHTKTWKEISGKKLEFFAVSFISVIQKQKDKPLNWFSNNQLLDNLLLKKVTSGWKFFNILHYLHCCPVANQDQLHYATGAAVQSKIKLVMK
jgi:hypothetical protein